MRGRLLAVVALAALVLVGCGGGEDRPDASASASSGSGTQASPGGLFSKDDADTVVHATETEFSIKPDPAGAKGEKVYFEIANTGGLTHELVVKAADGDVIGEREDIAPGKNATLAVELKPGTYTLVCELKTDDKTHEQLGMKTTFKVE